VWDIQSTHDGTSHDELLRMAVPARRTYIPRSAANLTNTCEQRPTHTYPHIHQKCEKWHDHRERSVPADVSLSATDLGAGLGPRLGEFRGEGVEEGSALVAEAGGAHARATQSAKVWFSGKLTQGGRNVFSSHPVRVCVGMCTCMETYIDSLTHLEAEAGGARAGKIIDKNNRRKMINTLCEKSVPMIPVPRLPLRRAIPGCSLLEPGFGQSLESPTAQPMGVPRCWAPADISNAAPAVRLQPHGSNRR